MDFPIQYNDPVYEQLDSTHEKELKLPVGILSSIRDTGEKTNADKVSSAGAQTPYQFIPSTRKAVMKKYGIDPYKSPENASRAAGLLLKEALDRNKGDIEQAIGEYHGGVNRENWGDVNEAYRKRVSAAVVEKRTKALVGDFKQWLNRKQPKKETKTLVTDFAAWKAKRQTITK